MERNEGKRYDPNDIRLLCDAVYCTDARTRDVLMQLARDGHKKGWVGMSGSFNIMQFPEPSDPAAVFVDLVAGQMFIEEIYLCREFCPRSSGRRVRAVTRMVPASRSPA